MRIKCKQQGVIIMYIIIILAILDTANGLIGALLVVKGVVEGSVDLLRLVIWR